MLYSSHFFTPVSPSIVSLSAWAVTEGLGEKRNDGKTFELLAYPALEVPPILCFVSYRVIAMDTGRVTSLYSCR